MRLSSLDHLVLTVRDLDATVRFYVDGLGMELRAFEGGRKALHFGCQKINLHVAGREFEPKALLPTPGSADLCFLTDDPLAEVVQHLAAKGSDARRAGRARRRSSADRLDLSARSGRQSDRDRQPPLSVPVRALVARGSPALCLDHGCAFSTAAI